MTAVQQYWIVDNDVNLVSNLTPVPVADEDALRAYNLGLFSFHTDDTPLDGWAGAVALQGIELVTITIPQYTNPFDSADKWKGASALSSVLIAAVPQSSYDNPYDTADKWKGTGMSLSSFTVTTVVVTYDNLYDTTDKWKGAPALNGVTIT